MEDVYILNRALEQIGVIDDYTSLIWANRYHDVGDCELYVQAAQQTFSLLQIGYYLCRLKDEMVCRIEKIEIDTDAEQGNYFIIYGRDVKGILAQRIVWTQTNIDSTVERYLRRLVTENIISPDIAERKIEHFALSKAKGFSEHITEQSTYTNLGEKIQEVCKTFGYGWRVILGQESGADRQIFYFDLYKGQDRSYDQYENPAIIFSPDYENLITTKYMEDATKLGNVALVAGEGEGKARKRGIVGQAKGIDRYEVYVDAKDISSSINLTDLTAAFPNGKVVEEDGSRFWQMNSVDVLITTEEQLKDLRQQYPHGEEIIKDGVSYFQITNIIIAVIDGAGEEESSTATLLDITYIPLLLARGVEKLADYGTTITFEGSVEPAVTFVYKKDYFLGDIVTVENEYKIRANARIVEIIETFDQDGYHIEPKFEYLEARQ